MLRILDEVTRISTEGQIIEEQEAFTPCYPRLMQGLATQVVDLLDYRAAMVALTDRVR